MHRYLSGNTKVISQLKRVSVVNSHWLYPSLMTYRLNKSLNLKEKEKYPVQASQLSMSRFILIEINIHWKGHRIESLDGCLLWNRMYCSTGVEGVRWLFKRGWGKVMPWKQKLNKVTIDKPLNLTEFQTILHILYIK